MNNKGILLYKNNNIKVIIRELRRHNGIEKKELQKRSGLSFATVSGICNELVEKGLVEEEHPATNETGVGRIPKILRMKPMARFGLCIDMQNRGEVLMVLKGICGSEAFRITWQYPDPADTGAIVERCHRLFTQQLKAKNIRINDIIGVGVALPGIFDLHTEAVAECAIPEWDGVHFKALFQQVFALPCYVDNQMNLSVSQVLADEGTALGQHPSAVYLHVGEGLGVGVIINGRLLRGAHGYASEICHLPLGDPTLKCPRCGNYGCAENELSKSGFVKKYAAVGNGRQVDYNEFVALATAGDATALEVVRSAAEVMAKCVTTLLTLFDPERLYVGYCISELYPLMSEAVSRRVASLGDHYAAIPIVLDTAGWDAVPNGIMEMLIQKWNPLAATVQAG